MAAASSGSSSALFDLKSAALTAMALVLKSTDVMALASALEERFGTSPSLFDHDPVVIDLQAGLTRQDIEACLNLCVYF